MSSYGTNCRCVKTWIVSAGRPQHGKLSDYTTTASTVTYTPDLGIIMSLITVQLIMDNFSYVQTSWAPIFLRIACKSGV
jgi:hypothetical protein